MSNLTKETTRILDAISDFAPVRSSEIQNKLKISSKNLYKHIARLLDEELIQKTGTTPRVYYTVSDQIVKYNKVVDRTDKYIEENYIYVSPNGELFRGVIGFEKWCIKNKFIYAAEKKKLVAKLSSLNKFKKNNLISAKKIILSKKQDLYIDDIFFSDFYNIDYFGKTKLGQLVYVGKSSQNKDLIREIGDIIKPSLEFLIKKYSINHICFIPPTIDRKVQFLDVLKKSLSLNVNESKASKVPTLTKIAQKTLRKLEDRIFNAQSTIAVNPNQEIIGNVLIIDDATGSGATINETAKKIRKISPKKTKIIGYSVVGSLKGFDVISEV